MLEGSRGKAREDHYVQSVRVCISVAVDYLREAEWKVCYLRFGFFVGFGAAVAGERGAGQLGVMIKSGNPLLANQPLPFLVRRSAKILPRRCPWFAALGFHFFLDPTVTSLGRDNTHSNWPQVYFDLASISSMLDHRQAASYWPPLCTTSA